MRRGRDRQGIVVASRRIEEIVWAIVEGLQDGERRQEVAGGGGGRSSLWHAI